MVPLARPGLEIEPGPGVLARARSPLPAAGGLEAAGRRPSQGGAPRKAGEAEASEGKGGRKMESEWRKEGGVPGLRGPVPALCVGPTRGPASGRAAARIPPARSARGPLPAAPAAPRTRRAALVTGGGGRGDPGGLGVGRPGGREAVVRVAAPALPLSLFSIPHLMRRQTDQHSSSCTARLPAGTRVLAPRCPFPSVATRRSPNLGLDPLPSHPHTHSPPTGPAAQGCPLAPPPPPSSKAERPCQPQPALLCSLSGPETHAPTLRPFRDPDRQPWGQGDCHSLHLKGMGAHARVPSPPLSSLPEDAGTCREEERPRRPAMGLRETKSRVGSPSPSPSRALVRAARSTCSRRAHLGLRPPASPRWVAWGGAGRERRGCSVRRAGEGRGLRAVALGEGPAPRPRTGRRGRARSSQTREAAGGSAPGAAGRGAVEGGAAFPRLSRRAPDSQPQGLRGNPLGSRQGLAPSSQHTHLPRPPPQPPGDRGQPGRG